jgi:hypothetical protein
MPGIGLKATASIGSSVVDSVTFTTNPDSRIRTNGLPILFFSSKTKTRTKIIFFQPFFCLLPFDTVVDPDDPDPPIIKQK